MRLGLLTPTKWWQNILKRAIIVSIVPLLYPATIWAQGLMELGADSEHFGNIIVSSNVTIRLNGHCLKMVGNAQIVVTDGATLTIEDNENTSRYWEYSGSNKYWTLKEDQSSANNTLNPYVTTGGCIMGHNGASSCIVVESGGALVLNGGNIVGNHTTEESFGGGITVRGTCTINAGATICGNSAAYCGGGIFDNGHLIITGGAITNNFATNYAGGICSTGESIQLSGNPYISGNTNSTKADNLYICMYPLNIVGTLTNTTPIGITLSDYAASVFTSGLSSKGNATNFSSDDPYYGVALTNTGEARLSTLLTSENISVASIDYDGEEHTAQVKFNTSTPLTEGIHYTVSGTNELTDVSSTTFSITGIGDYTGTVSGITFDITKPVFLNSGYEWITYYDGAHNLEVPSGYEAFTVSNASLTDKTVTTVEIGYIPATTPVILHKTGEALGEYHLKAATGTLPSHFSGYTGVTTATTVGDLQGDIQYILVGDEFVLLDASEGGSIGANRCYLYFTSGPAASRLSINDGTTGIKTATIGTENRWFDINGRRLSGMPTKKGLYIMNNKKVVIK